MGLDYTSDLIPCCSMCCIITSCYLTFPDCFGCESSSAVCCLESECITCKCISKDPRICCVFSRSDCVCAKPTTCIRGSNQAFCLDCRCACPCDENVPCVLGLLPFCVCCVRSLPFFLSPITQHLHTLTCILFARWRPKVLWCAKIKDIIAK